MPLSIITAYCCCVLCTGTHSPKGITASGQKPVQGITVAASRNIPFGTKVMIAGHMYVVQDRLARRYDNRVDIYFNRHKDALKFGKQTMEITVYEKRNNIPNR